MQQRRIANVGMTNDPTDIGSCPVDLAGIDAVVVLIVHFSATMCPPLSRMTPLGATRGAGCVENVEGIRGGKASATCLASARLGIGNQARPIIVAPRPAWLASAIGRCNIMTPAACAFERSVRRQARACSARCGPVRCRRRQIGSRSAWIIDAGGQFRCGKAAKDHRVNGADARRQAWR